MSKPKIILIGGGGHCRSCIDVIEQENRFEIAGIVEKSRKHNNPQVLGYPIVGTDDDIEALSKKYQYALVTVGQIKSSATRINIFARLKKLGFKLPCIISPRSYISSHAKIGQGTIIMHQALLNAGAVVGDNCIINTKTLVEHDVLVGDHCHVAPGAVLSGGTNLGMGSFFGSNAMSKENVIIGQECVIGGGENVLRDTPPHFITSRASNIERISGCECVDISSSVQQIERPIKLAIFGASGFSRETADIAVNDQIKEIVFIDIAPEKDSCFGYPLLSEDCVANLDKNGFLFIIGIGNNTLRKQIFTKFKNLKYPNLIHPGASFGRHQRKQLCQVHGNIVTAGAHFTNSIKIGNFGIYNLNCTVGHDCLIDDYINIAPGANVSGNVCLQEGAYIGTNAAILPGKSIEKKLSIGAFSTIGGGALVSKDVETYDTMIGVPAKRMKVSDGKI